MIKSSNLLIFYFNRRACLSYTTLMLSYLGPESYKLFTLKEHFHIFERIDNILYIPRNVLGILLFTPLALVHFFSLLLIHRKRSTRNLVYLPSFHPYNTLLCLVAKLLKYEIVLSVHDYETHLGEKSLITEKLQKSSIAWASQCIFLSNHEYQKALRGGIAKTKSIIIPHPIPEDGDLNILEYSLPLKVLFLGRIIEYKGIQVLQEALKGLENIQLTIAGEGNWNMVDESIPRLKCVKGYISDRQWKELMCQHHVLVLPYQEASQSGIIGEALAYRIPLILSSLPGLHEQISKHAAIFFECNDAEDLKNRISNLNSVTYQNLKLQLKEEYTTRRSHFTECINKLKLSWGI